MNLFRGAKRYSNERERSVPRTKRFKHITDGTLPKGDDATLSLHKIWDSFIFMTTVTENVIREVSCILRGIIFALGNVIKEFACTCIIVIFIRIKTDIHILFHLILKQDR